MPAAAHAQDAASTLGNTGPSEIQPTPGIEEDSGEEIVITGIRASLQAAVDLKAKKLFPVHSSKFMMANHPWDEPLSKITELNKKVGLPLVTPIIGERVDLKRDKKFPEWWVGLR